VRHNLGGAKPAGRKAARGAVAGAALEKPNSLAAITLPLWAGKHKRRSGALALTASIAAINRPRLSGAVFRRRRGATALAILPRKKLMFTRARPIAPVLGSGVAFRYLSPDFARFQPILL